MQSSLDFSGFQALKQLFLKDFGKNNKEGSAEAQILAEAPCNQEIVYFK